MNAPVPVSSIASSVPASLAEAELDAALSFADQEKSASTRRSHRSDWRIFTAWCAAATSIRCQLRRRPSRGSCQRKPRRA